MSLNGTLLCFVQVLLGLGAFECAQPLHASCDDTNQLISKGRPFSTLSSPDDAVLLAFPFKHHSVTSSSGTAIKEHRQDFIFCGHGGSKAVMSLNGTLLCFVQVLLGLGAFECAQPLHASCDDTNQLISKGRPFSTLSSPDDAVLLAFPFKHHSVTSSSGTAIKEHRQDFIFCGHGGSKAAMSLNGTLLCFVQVLLGLGAFECAQPLHASCDDTNQLISKGRPFSTLSSPDDAVLLAFPFKHHSVTSSSGTAIKEHRQDFIFCGHGGSKAVHVAKRNASLLRAGFAWPRCF
ncbi:hypothetical protein MTO96_049672 [Rhipicephalus appendiculatus]